MASRQWWVAAADTDPAAHLLTRAPTERAGGPGAIGAALCGQERQTWQPLGILDQPAQYKPCQPCQDLADRRAAGITQHYQGAMGRVRAAAVRPGQNVPDAVLAALGAARYCRDDPTLTSAQAKQVAARELVDMLFADYDTGELTDPTIQARAEKARAARVVHA